MRLYYKPGACSLASHIVLREIDAEFDLEQVDTDAGRTETGADYTTVNRNGYVPDLRLDNGTVVTENMALLQYLGGLRPERGLLPAQGTMEYVRLQETLSFLASELHKAFSPLFSGADLSPAQRQDVHRRISGRIGHLDRQLADGRPFLLGDDYSVADAYAFAVLNWTGFVDFPLADFPDVERYIRRVGERPAVIDALKAEGLVQ